MDGVGASASGTPQLLQPELGVNFSIFEGRALSKGDNLFVPKSVMLVLKRSVFDSRFQRKKR